MIHKNKTQNDYNYVLLKKRLDNFGGENIVNENGQIIGKIIFPFFSQNKELKVRDLTNDRVFILNERKTLSKILTFLKDKDENLICKFIRKKSILPPSKIFIKDCLNNTRYLAEGDINNWNYEVKSISNGEMLARIENAERMKSLFQKLSLNFGNYYFVEFLESHVEKIIIICIAIAVNSVSYKFHGVSDTMGIARKIARLRPFGPGKSLN